MTPILAALLAYWVLVAMLAIRESRALKRRIRELEAEKARGKG